MTAIIPEGTSDHQGEAHVSPAFMGPDAQSDIAEVSRETSTASLLFIVGSERAFPRVPAQAAPYASNKRIPCTKPSWPASPCCHFRHVRRMGQGQYRSHWPWCDDSDHQPASAPQPPDVIAPVAGTHWTPQPICTSCRLRCPFDQCPAGCWLLRQRPGGRRSEAGRADAPSPASEPRTTARTPEPAAPGGICPDAYPAGRPCGIHIAGTIVPHALPSWLRRLLHRPVHQFTDARPASRQTGRCALPSSG